MSLAKEQLRQLVARIERLEEEKAAIAEGIKDVYAEAKAFGFDTKVLRKVIALRKRDPQEREEEAALIDLYMEALGMTPIERAIADAELKAGKGEGETTLTVSTDGGPAVSMTLGELRQSIDAKFERAAE